MHLGRLVELAQTVDAGKSAGPNVRAKRATAAWRAGQQAQNGPQAQRLMASVTCRWRSA